MIWVLFALFFGLVASFFLHRWMERREIDRLLHEAAGRGECIVCFYHQRFAPRDSEPRPHLCINEAKCRANLKLIR